MLLKNLDIYLEKYPRLKKKTKLPVITPKPKENLLPKFISEVRGRGLFLGIDLINNKKNNPNEKLAKFIINKMRQKGILLGIDGPYHNVIKIKPPMTFNKKNVDLVCFELNNVFTNL